MELSRSKLLLIFVVSISLLSQTGLSSSSSSSLSEVSPNGAEGLIRTDWTQGLPHDDTEAGLLAEREEDDHTRLQRLLLGITPHISYGALRADNVRCPPMSGRSYYLPNCRTATGPVNPYERGCLALTRCGRDTS